MSAQSEKAAAWIYQGIWRILADWFAAPAEPPELPAHPGEVIERFHPAPGFMRYLKFKFWVMLTLVDAMFLFVWLVIFYNRFWLGVALSPIFFAVAVLPDIVAYVGIHLQYDTTWYLLSERSLRIRRGIWTIREATITFENVQDVKIQQGPLQRHYGIANVIVETAGGGGGQSHGKGASTSHTGVLEGVAEAKRIRDLIMARVKRSRTTGLGDEGSSATAIYETRKSSEAAWTSEHIAALRDIKSELTRLREETAVSI
jgi:membrane protein YdbS with pleckstrin-like domain